jgi:hypothetical protein
MPQTKTFIGEWLGVSEVPNVGTFGIILEPDANWRHLVKGLENKNTEKLLQGNLYLFTIVAKDFPGITQKELWLESWEPAYTKKVRDVLGD